eukprot:c26706_g1_i1 orf=969-2600(+)
MMQTRPVRGKGLGNKIDPSKGVALVDPGKGIVDVTASLSDEILLKILNRLPSNPYPCSLVCKRWLRLHSQLRQSIKVREWSFVESGRLPARFPNLTDVDLTAASISPPKNSPVVFTHQFLTIQLGTDAYDTVSIERFIEDQQLSPSALDKGLRILADGCPGLQRLSVVDVRRATYNRNSFRRAESLTFDKANKLWDESSLNSAIEGKNVGKMGKDGVTKLDMDSRHESKIADSHLSEAAGRDGDITKLRQSMQTLHLTSEQGLAYIAIKCPTLQELELRQCTDETLSAISACQHLQILRLVGTITGFYHCTFTDIGLTILARNCNRLVKLELSGCEASYDGIAAIGQCCLMLEELTLSNQGFYEGWIAALSFCRCLKTLRLENCKQIDPIPGPTEHLGHCEALEHLQLVRCDLRDRVGFTALMLVCMPIKELEIQDCWGLDDDTFSIASNCRRVKHLSLEGCSLLTTAGLENVVLSWKDLQSLLVVYCNRIKDFEVTTALGLLFSTLKELKWRPDSKSFLALSLAGTGVGQKGGKFFKKGGPT